MNETIEGITIISVCFNIGLLVFCVFQNLFIKDYRRTQRRHIEELKDKSAVIYKLKINAIEEGRKT